MDKQNRPQNGNWAELVDSKTTYWSQLIQYWY